MFLRGRLTSPAQERVLESGTVIVNYEVSVERDDGPKESVPVAWHDPPASARARQYDTGDEVVVVGRVRRRFFRAGGATQSRTEVVAVTFLPARHTKRVAAAIDEWCDAVSVAAGR